jgi:O-acetyl-ADP-ribose deacetylase (regulator of RNase III)
MRPSGIHRVDVELVTGDITGVRVDAIVNAANEALAPGGGVCGAIMRAGGPRLAADCRRIGHCPTGGAVASVAGDLAVGHVIHAVGPVWRGGDAGEEEQLASCHRAAMAVAAGLGCRVVAFPAISTGIYGYPIARAAPVAIRAVREAAAPPLERVVFVLFTPADHAVFAAALARIQASGGPARP